MTTRDHAQMATDLLDALAREIEGTCPSSVELGLCMLGHALLAIVDELREIHAAMVAAPHEAATIARTLVRYTEPR